MEWRGKKVFLTAPTGMGKTTFILQKMLPYMKIRRQKMLILCNRKLLRQQYWYELVSKFDSYAELDSAVSIDTYQNLASRVKDQENILELFKGYEVIVCDEAHYFYSDSDFNGFGTYVLLQAIIMAGLGKEMIFLSATMDEVKPLILRTIRKCCETLKITDEMLRDYVRLSEIVDLDYSVYADTKRFECSYVPDGTTLCKQIKELEGKTIIFIDDKAFGEQLKKDLIKIGGVKENEIMLLSSDNIDNQANEELVENLTINHKLICRVLITTAVLDNGVSIHDPDVEMLVIMTCSRTSFLQMAGRVRAESCNHIKLCFLGRSKNYYRKRIQQLEEERSWLEELENESIDNIMDSFAWEVLEGNIRNTRLYQKMLVWAKRDICYYSRNFLDIPIKLNKREKQLYINLFAKQKIDNEYLMLSRLYENYVKDPVHVIHEQMKWLGKEPEELKIILSDYKKEQTKKLRSLLLSIDGISKEELKEIKKRIISEYCTALFPKLMTKNGSISQKNFIMICENVGLLFEKQTENDRKIRYYVREKGADCKNE